MSSHQNQGYIVLPGLGFHFRLTHLFGVMVLSKFSDGRVHFRNSEVTWVKTELYYSYVYHINRLETGCPFDDNIFLVLAYLLI